jgi:hypothetical protein
MMSDGIHSRGRRGKRRTRRGRAETRRARSCGSRGGGAGGASSSSDLGVATNLATLIVCQSGLGDDGFVRWTMQPTAEQDKQIDEVINAACRSIRSRLQACRALLDSVSAALEEKQELSGKELRRLAKSIGSAVASA